MPNNGRVARASGVLARRGLSRALYAEWVGSRLASNQPVERVLAWAGSEADPAGDLVIGTHGRLSVSTGSSESPSRSGPSGPGSPADEPADDPARAWSHLGWHRIERGSWNGEARRLSWTDYDGVRGSATLPRPGRVPELFRERIAASIAVEEIVQVGGGRSVAISGRRDLSAPESRLEWQTSLSRGLNWQQPGLRALAEEVLARLQAEYDRR